jgi:hypothetical protein
MSCTWTVALTRLYVLVFIEHGTRRMHIGVWTVQQARNLALDLGERFTSFRFLIRDRGPNFTRSSGAVFPATGTTIVRTAVQAPRMYALCERPSAPCAMSSPTGPDPEPGAPACRPGRIPGAFQRARPHQGIDQRVPDPAPAPRVTAADPGTWQIRRKPVLSGLINEYQRAA